MTDQTTPPQDHSAQIEEELAKLGVEPEPKLEVQSEESPEPEDNQSQDQSNPEPPVQETDNREEETTKAQEWQQKLTASKQEALRLKAERDELKLQLEKNSKQIAKGKKPDLDPEEAENIKATLQNLGVAFTENVESVKQTMYQEKIQHNIDKFTKQFPEYGKIGDSESDGKWTALQEEFNLFRKPNSPEEYYLLLQRAHENMTARGERSKAFERGKNLGYAKANLAEKATLGSKGSSATKAPSKRTSEQDLIDRELGVSDIVLS